MRFALPFVLFCSFGIGCGGEPVAPPARAPVPETPRPVPAPAVTPATASTAATRFDERCVRRYTDEQGFERYDLSCEGLARADADNPSRAVPDAECTRRFTDEKGFVRYDHSCAHRDATTLETAARKEACTARGGEWGKHGWLEFEGCAWHAKDAGKPCRDRSECESRVCLAPTGASRGRPATGGCSECVGDCALSGLVVEQGSVRARIHEN